MRTFLVREASAVFTKHLPPKLRRRSVNGAGVSQKSDRAKTRRRKTRRAEKNEVQCFRAYVDLILSMRGFLTDGRAHRRSFFFYRLVNHPIFLKRVPSFLTDG